MELVVVAALLRTEELVSVDDILGRKSILGTIDSSRGGIMLCEEIFEWLFLLVSSGGSDGWGNVS